MASCSAPSEMAAKPPDSQRLFRPSSDRDWEPFKEVIAALYQFSNLKTVVKEMETAYFFKATNDQYKNRIAKWGLDKKNIKASEYHAMLKHIKRRQKLHPSKQTQFILHGKLVDAVKIARFVERAKREGKISDEDTFSDVEDPTGLDHFTPPLRARDDASLPLASPLLLQVQSPHIPALDSSHRAASSRQPLLVAAGAEALWTADETQLYLAPDRGYHAGRYATGAARAAADLASAWQAIFSSPQNLSAAPSLPRLLPSPGHLRSMEIARAGVQTFFVRVLQPGTTGRVMESPSTADGWAIAKFYSLSQTLSACMAASRFDRINELRIYEEIQNIVDQIIEEKNPILLTCLLQICCRFVQEKQTRCLQILLHYIGSQASMHAGARPLELLCRSLLEAMDCLPSLLISSTSLATETLSCELAPEHSQTLSASRGLYSALVSSGDYAGALEIFQHVLEHEAKTERHNSAATSLYRLDALMRVIGCELNMFHLHDAERHIIEMGALLQALEVAGEKVYWHFTFWYLGVKGELLRLRRNPEARDLLEQAHRLAVRECQWINWWTVIHAEEHLAMATSLDDPESRLIPWCCPT